MNKRILKVLKGKNANKNDNISMFVISVILFVILFQLIFSLIIVQRNLYKIFFYYANGSCNQAIYNVDGYVSELKDILIRLSLDNDIKHTWYEETLSAERNKKIRQVMDMYFYSDLLIEKIYIYNNDGNVMYEYSATANTKKIIYNSSDEEKEYLYNIVSKKEDFGNNFNIYMNVNRSNYMYSFYAVYYPYIGSNNAIILKCNSSAFREKIDSFNLNDSGVFIIDERGEVMYTNYTSNNEILNRKELFEKFLSGKRDWIFDRKSGNNLFLLKVYSQTMKKWCVFVIDGNRLYIKDTLSEIYYYLIFLFITSFFTICIIMIMRKKISSFILYLNTENAKKYEQYVINTRDRNNFSKALIGNSDVDIEKEMKNIGLNIKSDEMIIMLISICNYKNIIKKYKNEKEFEGLKNLIIMSVNEILGVFFRIEGFSLSKNKILYIVEKNKEKSDFETEFSAALDTVHKVIYDTLAVEFNAIIDTIDSYLAIPMSFSRVEEMTKYEWVYGKGCTIDYSKIVSGWDCISKTELKNMIDTAEEYICSTRYTEAEEIYKEFKQKVRSIRIEDIKSQFSILENMLYKSIVRCHNVFGFNYHIDILDEIEKMNSAKSYDELCISCDNFFDRVIQPMKNEQSKSDANERMCDMVVDIIENEYSEPALCLEYVAQKLNRSPNYLNKVFLSVKNETIPKFIISYRIIKACEYLKETELPVNSVAVRVGIMNNSYFGSLFKKQMGVTPKQYRERNRK